MLANHHADMIFYYRTTDIPLPTGLKNMALIEG